MSQILKKFISANAIDGTKLQLLNSDPVRALDHTGANKNLFQLNGSDKIDFLGNGLTNLADPSSAQDAATKNYVDSQVSNHSTSYKQAAQAATAAALPANTFAAVGGGADTLTATANAALVVDGYSVQVGDRILVKNEATASNNGIYVVTQVGDATHPYILTRAVDMQSWSQVPGSLIFVEQGSANALQEFMCNALPGGTFDTTAINFVSGPGANKSLSNLSATAINNNLNPDSNSARSIGTSSLTWLGVHAQSMYANQVVALMADGSNTDIALQDGGTVPSGASVKGSLISVGGDLGVYSAAGMGLHLESANATGATNSGNVSIQTGTVVSGTRGKVVLNGSAVDASSTNIINVANPVNAQDAATKSYTDTAVSNEATARTNADNLLLDLAGTRLMTGTLQMNGNDIKNAPFIRDASNFPTIDNANRYLKNTDGSISVKWNSRQLVDSGGSTISVDWLNRKLDATGGQTMIDWSTWPNVNFNTNGIINLADPTTAQGGATKNYVDTQTALKVSKAGDSMSGTLNMAGNSITNVAAPVAGSDAVNKTYVDNKVSGLSWRPEVNLLDSVDTTKPSGASATIDGVAVANGMRVLFTALSSGNNEVYVASGVGTAITWTLATDGQSGTGAPAAGDALLVLQGTSYSQSGWDYNGTQWVQFNGAGQISAGTGLVKSGNTISVNYGAGVAAIPSGDVGINLYSASGLDLVDPGTGLHSTAANAQLSAKAADKSILVNSSGLAVQYDASGALATNGNGVIVQVDGVTVKINGSNKLEGLKGNKETFTLAAGDITNGYVDLAHVAANNSVMFMIKGAGVELEGDTFTVSYTGGAGGNTRITWIGSLASGSGALAAGDKIQIMYQYI